MLGPLSHTTLRIVPHLLTAVHITSGYMHSIYTRVHVQVCTLVACVMTPTQTTGSDVERAVRVNEATPASAGRRQRATWQGRKAVCLSGACCRECCRDSGLSRHGDRWPGPSTARWDVAAASYLQTNGIVVLVAPPLTLPREEHAVGDSCSEREKLGRSRSRGRQARRSSALA